MATSALAVQNWFETTLSGGINASDTDIGLNSVPTGTEGYLIIEPDGTTTREVIYYTSKTSNSVVLTSAANGRGVDGTTAQAHSAGATVRMQITSGYWNALQDGTALANNSILTANITNDAITAAKIDWASTGANGGIWWEELGRTTLSTTSDTIDIASFPNRKYLYIIIHLYNSGQLDPQVTFNGDTGNNYALRISNNGAADSTSTSRANWTLMVAGGSYPAEATIEVRNISALEKIGLIHAWEQNTAGAANAPNRTERIGKWANTSSAITQITVTNVGTGDFQAGSEVIVLGHN